MNAISGTRRAMKELVDGTIRVQIDIDPTQRAAFHKLFGEIDMPVALAPLKVGAVEVQAQSVSGEVAVKVVDVEPKEKPGPLCVLACTWCQEPAFHEWMAAIPPSKDNPLGWGKSEREAKRLICYWCGIESRKELDTNEDAKDKFQRLIRGPFMKWKEGK